MGETHEIYSEIRKISKNKRAANREWSANKLTELGVTYEYCNNGAHLIVQGSVGYIDFWPGTGKWIARNGTKGRGLKSLLNLVGVKV